MKKILITAFSAFGDYPANSSELIARKALTTKLSGYRVAIEIFAATIAEDDRGASVFRSARAVDAERIICLGMASSKKGLCVEAVAVNRIKNDRYCPAHLNDTSIDRDYPYARRLSLDLTDWDIEEFRVQCAMAQIATERSNDAGCFCCNQLIWQMRLAQEQRLNRRIPWIFLHVPCSPESVPRPEADFYCAGKTSMSVKDALRGLEILLETSEQMHTQNRNERRKPV